MGVDYTVSHHLKVALGGGKLETVLEVVLDVLVSVVGDAKALSRL